MNILVIFARAPIPGACKTRLASGIGPAQAAELSESFIADLVERFQTRGDRRIVCHAPASPDAVRFFETLCGQRYELWPQSGGSLGERLTACLRRGFGAGAQAMVVVGSDSPTLPGDFIDRAFAMLADNSVVLGPATDGGFYLIGMRADTQSAFDRPDSFDGVVWSSPDVLRQTVARIGSAGWSLGLLPPWYDVDSIDDLAMLRGHLAAIRLAQRDAAEEKDRTPASDRPPAILDLRPGDATTTNAPRARRTEERLGLDAHR